ncbi:hypothetical protein ACH4RG_14105 [Streptomyces sp. NPDC021019]|uniref:hypothetical protein n=1 Tax=Streptomyces sp. NPDC021019 TaxID=3365108 RepID=UPI0037BC2276
MAVGVGGIPSQRATRGAVNTGLWAWARDGSDRLGPALDRAVLALAGRISADDVVGVGVATDADATSIVACAHSRHHLDQMIAEGTEFAIAVKWHLGEWHPDIVGLQGIDDPLVPIRAESERAKQRFTGTSADPVAVPGLRAFRRAVWDSVSQASTDSVARGFFEQWPSAVRFFLPLTPTPRVRTSRAVGRRTERSGRHGGVPGVPEDRLRRGGSSARRRLARRDRRGLILTDPERPLREGEEKFLVNDWQLVEVPQPVLTHDEMP